MSIVTTNFFCTNRERIHIFTHRFLLPFDIVWHSTENYEPTRGPGFEYLWKFVGICILLRQCTQQEQVWNPIIAVQFVMTEGGTWRKHGAYTDTDTDTDTKKNSVG